MKQSAAFKGAREQSHIQLDTFSSETARWVEPRPDADAKLAEALQECERLRGSYQRGEAHAWTQAAQIIEAQDSMQGWKRRIAMLFRDNADGAISRALSKGE